MFGIDAVPSLLAHEGSPQKEAGAEVQVASAASRACMMSNDDKASTLARRSSLLHNFRLVCGSCRCRAPARLIFGLTWPSRPCRHDWARTSTKSWCAGRPDIRGKLLQEFGTSRRLRTTNEASVLRACDAARAPAVASCTHFVWPTGLLSATAVVLSSASPQLSQLEDLALCHETTCRKFMDLPKPYSVCETRRALRARLVSRCRSQHTDDGP